MDGTHFFECLFVCSCKESFVLKNYDFSALAGFFNILFSETNIIMIPNQVYYVLLFTHLQRKYFDLCSTFPEIF